MGKTRSWSVVAAALAAFVLSGCGGGAELGGGGTTGGSLGGSTGGTTGGTTTTYRAGYLDGTIFVNGQVYVGTTALDAGGQTAVRVDIVDQSGARAQNVSATVTFSSDCAAANTSRFQTAVVTTTSGRADSTYIAQGCAGNDVIHAVIEVDGAQLAATRTVSVQASELGAIQFVSATPAVIGMTGSTIPGQSVVVFKVIDQTGGVVPNQLVTFSLSTTAGGISLAPAQATTDSQGLVQTVVRGGSAQASVTVRADATSPLSGLQVPPGISDPIAVTTGLADADSVSVAAAKLALDGGCDGENTSISVRLADRYNNPVPAGTQPVLTAEGGKISGNCVTAEGSATTEAGVCSVIFVVQNPRPANGRVSILAYVSGEESFSDNNGNGFFDGGDSFVDLPEAFNDYNENSTRDTGEFFADANANQAYDGGNGEFDGYVCDAPGENCRSTSTNVSGSIVVTFSRRDPVLGGIAVATDGSYSGGVLTFDAAKQLADVAVVVRDANGNPMPSGTTFKLSSSIGTVLPPVTVGPFNTSSAAISDNTFAFTMQAPSGATPDTGLATLDVIVPESACTGPTTTTIRLFEVRYVP